MSQVSQMRKAVSEAGQVSVVSVSTERDLRASIINRTLSVFTPQRSYHLIHVGFPTAVVGSYLYAPRARCCAKLVRPRPTAPSGRRRIVRHQMDMSTVDAALLAIASVRQVARAAAAARPDDLAALAKDVGVLAKLLRNPAENPEEPKFRKVKLSNATVARVLAHTGVRDVIIACGFSEDGTGECLELSDLSEPAVGLLLRAVASVEEVQLMLQELSWLHAARKEVPKLDGKPWNVDTAAREVVQACLGSLHAPWRRTDVTHKIVFVQQLHLILSTPGMRECRAAVEALKSVAVPALRRVALELIHLGALDVSALVQANRCLALLWPAGDASTLAGRLEFCSACLEAALPPDDEPMELRLRLTHGPDAGHVR